MKLSLYFKQSLLIITFFSINTSHCLPRFFAQEQTTQKIVNGIIATALGTALTTFGLAKICNIPVTATQEIALALQDRISKKDLEKLYLGRKITGYSTIALGLFLVVGGLGTVSLASKKA